MFWCCFGPSRLCDLISNLISGFDSLIPLAVVNVFPGFYSRKALGGSVSMVRSPNNTRSFSVLSDTSTASTTGFGKEATGMLIEQEGYEPTKRTPFDNKNGGVKFKESGRYTGRVIFFVVATTAPSGTC